MGAPVKRPEKLVKVYVTMVDGPEDGPSGPAGDGTFIRRFRTRRDADALARVSTCYGRPATVSEDEVPRRLAERWGCA